MDHLFNNIYHRQYWDYDYIIYFQNLGRVSGHYSANEQHMNMNMNIGLDALLWTREQDDCSASR
jgi:hypothetical protein